MSAPISHRPARVAAGPGLAAAAFVVLLTGCALPEPVQQPKPPTPATVSPAPKPVPKPAIASTTKPPAATTPRRANPVATTATPRTGLPPWVQAALAAPSVRHAVPASVVAAARPVVPQPAAPVPGMAEPVGVTAGVAPSRPPVTAPTAPPKTAPPHEPTLAFGAGDPVIQIPTPTYLARGQGNPSTAANLPGLAAAPASETAGKPAVVAASAAGSSIQTTAIERPSPAAEERPATTTPATVTAAPVVTAEMPKGLSEKAPAEAARPTPSAVAAATPAPSADEGFAGMPLPNLPALSPREAAAGAETAPVEIARNEAPPDIAPEPTPVTAIADVAETPAEAELRRAAERTGLSERQLDRIDRARRLIAAGDNAAALEQMQLLNAELDSAAVLYTVGAGDNLWRIAEKPEVYGNAFLWPLIWRANSDRVKEPYQLYKGMKLKVPTNPSVDRVAAALDYARQNGGEGLRPAAEAPSAIAP